MSIDRRCCAQMRGIGADTRTTKSPVILRSPRSLGRRLKPRTTLGLRGRLRVALSSDARHCAGAHPTTPKGFRDDSVPTVIALLLLSPVPGGRPPTDGAAFYANITKATPVNAINRASQISESRTYSVGRSMALRQRPALNKLFDLDHGLRSAQFQNMPLRG
jgi:hypothetical protein